MNPANGLFCQTIFQFALRVVDTGRFCLSVKEGEALDLYMCL